ncbi:MAG: NADH-quinone oxidoreductase subunit NuoE [Desulfurispora sp.]|uniref:NADH-quinone oxidoreductase subunit NuoE n=1 Tax=Desulfurispora sp. TaxID=3014275 RepID=UPI0040494392
MSSACRCGGELTSKLNSLLEEHRGQPAALIQVLHRTQQIYGYLPREALKKISLVLHVPLSKVYGVVSFYSLFSIYPKGRHQISVCKGTACYVRGAGQLLSRLKEEMGLEPGQTTPDGEFSLEVVRCLGACGLAPAVVVDGDVYARVLPESMSGILAAYQRKAAAGGGR